MNCCLEQIRYHTTVESLDIYTSQSAMIRVEAAFISVQRPGSWQTFFSSCVASVDRSRRSNRIEFCTLFAIPIYATRDRDRTFFGILFQRERFETRGRYLAPDVTGGIKEPVEVVWSMSDTAQDGWRVGKVGYSLWDQRTCLHLAIKIHGTL